MDEKKYSFSDFYETNGFIFWHAREFMRWLGYQSYQSFKNPINKAIGLCSQLSIPVEDNFKQEKRTVDGKTVDDYRLSRFSCYLVAMNADSRKPEVAHAQAYFAAMATAFEQYIKQSEEIERLNIREDISEHEKALSGVAKNAGVVHYDLFQNAGYRGLYNMNLSQLRKKKGIPDKRTPLDFMRKTELAANLFRITQTEEKLMQERIQGQKKAEQAATAVGSEVRQTMHRISGLRPEDLTIGEDIKKVRSAVKSSHKNFKKLDKPKSGG